MRQGDVVYYLHTDYLGSTSVLSDGSGQQAGERVAYLPYGGVRLGEASTLPTDYTFTGQRLEAGLGLMHYGARFYSLRLGRFVSADSVVPEPGEPQALNRFSYTQNNPLRYVDPSGHQPESWSWWDVAVMVCSFDIFAVQDWDLSQPRGTTTRRMQEQFEEAQEATARNIGEPLNARFPLLRTITEVSQTPEVQMGLMAAMMTANTPPGVMPQGARAISDSGITNPVPRRMARIVPAQYAESPTLAAPGAQEAFVTAADDIAGITTSQGLAERLTMVNEAGNLIEGPFAVFEFDAPASGVASPVYRSNAGFVGHGQTAGGAREFVIPNQPLSELENLIRRIIQ